MIARFADLRSHQICRYEETGERGTGRGAPATRGSVDARSFSATFLLFPSELASLLAVYCQQSAEESSAQH